MNNRQFSDLLEKYLKGNCNEDEITIVEKWYGFYENDPDHLLSLSSDQRSILNDRMLSRIISKISHGNQNDETLVKASKIISLQRWWWIGSVASLFIIALISLIIFPLSRKQMHVNDDLVYTNTSGSIIKKSLSDGSSVWLKPTSSIKVPKHFKADYRSITMNGECFFEITKNPKRPFIIVSTHIVTKVWGTSFKIVDYEKSALAVVKVINGKVSVNKKEDADHQLEARILKHEVILTPQQKVTYSQETGLLVPDLKTDMTDMGLWQHADFSFNDAKLSTIADELGKKFKVFISLKEEHLKNEVMTADLSDLNLAEVLDVLKVSMKIDYEIKGDRITITSTQK